jgi:hypothetical protein
MEWRNRERDDASGKSLFDLAKKYRQASKQANRGNSYLILFFLAGKNWVRFLTSFTSVCVAETHQQGVFFSFPFVSFAVIFISKLFIGLRQIHILCL